MSVGEGVALAGFALTVLTLICGAAWWMASLYALVKTIRDDLHQFTQSNEREHRELWAAIHTKQDKP